MIMPPPARALTLIKDRRSSVFCVFMARLLPLPAVSGKMNRLTNSEVCSASADIAAHRIINILVGRLRLAGQQRGGRHELPGLAVAALRHIHFHPRLLQRMRSIRRKAFDGLY